MPIPESEISILIPTYRYRDKVVRAVESALASGAGEIIVTDDRSGDGTLERLAVYSDPRLRVLENERNLGLWENHLHALSLATRPWIKYIQADDYLLPGGLAAYAAAADEGVTVVHGTPTVKDDVTGEIFYFHVLDRPIRVTPHDMQAALVYGGWILGSPSHMMLRASAIERDPAAWKTTISADLVVGSIASARGDTILLPAGAIGQGAHDMQDAKRQSAVLGMQRTVSSLSYLRQRPETGLRWLANMWAILQVWRTFRTAAGGVLRREASPAVLAGFPLRLLADITAADWRMIFANRSFIQAARRFRAANSAPYDLASLIASATGSAGRLANGTTEGGKLQARVQ